MTPRCGSRGNLRDGPTLRPGMLRNTAPNDRRNSDTEWKVRTLTMFEIIVRFFMQDTRCITTDTPALVIASLNMATVASISVERGA